MSLNEWLKNGISQYKTIFQPKKCFLIIIQRKSFKKRQIDLKNLNNIKIKVKNLKQMMKK